MSDPQNEKPPLDTWAFVEIFGHIRIAGHVTEERFGATSMFRVDVPKIGEQEGFTRYYGAGSVFSLTPTTEQVILESVARQAAYNAPRAYLPPQAPSMASAVADDEEYEGDYEEEPF